MTATAWNSIAYELIGMTVNLEQRMNWALAFAYGRDVDAVSDLAQKVFPTMSLDKRMEMLRSAAPEDDEVRRALTLVDGCVRLRNSLAHASLGHHSDTEATFYSTFRGRRSRTVLRSAMRSDLIKMHHVAMALLNRAESRIADVQVWARAYGLHADQRYLE